MVDPRGMCRQHLLGEHVELHMFVGHIRLGRKMGKFVTENLVETKSIQSRHEALVAEMQRRGYEHKSPMVYTDRLALGHVPQQSSLKELLRRCPLCRKQFKKLHEALALPFSERSAALMAEGMQGVQTGRFSSTQSNASNRPKSVKKAVKKAPQKASKKRRGAQSH